MAPGADSSSRGQRQPAASGDQPGWADVLARCEASATEAEATLRAGVMPDPARFAALAVYDLWQLSLPPLPAELRDRASNVLQRQLRLQDQLAAAMLGLAQQINLAEQILRSGTDPAAAAPRYLDRSA